MEKDKYMSHSQQPFSFESLEKQNIFQVPEGYFDELTPRIQSAVHDKAHFSPSFSIQSLLLNPRLAIAVILLAAGVVSAAVWVVNKQLSKTHKTPSATTINTTKGNKILTPSQSENRDSITTMQIRQPGQILVHSDESTQNPILFKKPGKAPDQKPIKEEKGMNVLPGITIPLQNSTQIIQPGLNPINSQPTLSNQSVLPQKNTLQQLVDLGNDTCSETPLRLSAGDLCSNCRYEWSTGETGNSILVNKSGTYWVKAIYIGRIEMIDYDTIKVKILPRPNVDLGPDKEICTGNSLTFSAGIQNKGYTYLWEPSGKTSPNLVFEPTIPGIYHFTLTVKGCSEVIDEINIVVNDCGVKVPNVITPNGDNINDYFIVEGLENYPGSSLIIFDRNGKKVFESPNYQNNWKGDNCPNGTYYYKLILSGHHPNELSGIITIVR